MGRDIKLYGLKKCFAFEKNEIYISPEMKKLKATFRNYFYYYFYGNKPGSFYKI